MYPFKGPSKSAFLENRMTMNGKTGKKITTCAQKI